jgi:hypothetical protein
MSSNSAFLIFSEGTVPAATENEQGPVEVLLTQYSSMCIFRNVSYISTAIHVGSVFFTIFIARIAQQEGRL